MTAGGGRKVNKNKKKADKSKGRLYMPRINYPPARGDGNKNESRNVTLSQLATMLWHLYAVSADPELGYLDSDISFKHFLDNKLNRTISISKQDLERLLWASHVAHQNGIFWAPNKKSLQDFIKDVIISTDEEFDYKLNLITLKSERGRVK